MLNISKILKRSWHILWNYRTLWIFGFILALTVGGSNFGSQSRYNANDRNNNDGIQTPNDWDWKGLEGDTPREKLDDAFRQMGAGIQKLQAQYPVEFRMGIAVAITFFVVIFLLSIVAAILRYIAETASIRMVDEYEQTGVKVGFRQGWKYGWSRTSWRLFLINFIAHIPSLVLFVVLGLVTWWIVSAALSGVESALVTSLIAGIGLAFLFIFVTAILMVVLYVLRDFAWRIAALEGTGVMESLNKAASLVKRQWKNVGLMWLVMIGIKIAWAIAFVILIFPLLILSILTAVGGLLAAIIPSLLTAGLASLLSAPDYWPWAFAAIIGLPFFFVVTFSPILLVSGWGQIYQSSTWTLTYREIKALETVAPVVSE
ncbi:MAG: hypothetical protein EHM81_11605 [Chloroflexi bacterium]|nr:MAG: hypothetical protein EHM81_11605 [Chloroflexota bacterium]